MPTPLITYHRPPALDGVELLHCMDRDFSLAPHVHDEYVFWFNGLGGDRVMLGGSTNILHPDSFGVVAPGEVHANHAVTDKRTLNSMYVSTSIIEDIALQSGCAASEFRSQLHNAPQTRATLARLHSILMRSDDAFLVRESFLSTFSILLQRHGENTSHTRIHNDPVKVQQARSIMDKQFDGQLDIDDIAEHCGCSTCHLIRLFRRTIGMTPHAYLMERRLCHAKDQLPGPAAISSIALDSGFTDQSHLTRRFHTRFGLTPGQYRTQISF